MKHDISLAATFYRILRQLRQHQRRSRRPNQDPRGRSGAGAGGERTNAELESDRAKSRAYVDFVNRVTTEILRKGIFTDRDAVFNSAKGFCNTKKASKPGRTGDSRNQPSIRDLRKSGDTYDTFVARVSYRIVVPQSLSKMWTQGCVNGET